MSLTWPEVAARIARGEDPVTEFKLWPAFPDKVAVALAAMANSEGGLVLLGVADDGSLVGVPEAPESVRERLTTLLQSGLSAPLGATLGHQEVEGRHLHWVQVPKVRGPEPLRRNGRVYVRRGRSSAEPSPSELQELFNVFGFVVTEEQVVPGTTVDDVDVPSFRRFLERQGFDTNDEPQPSLTADLHTRMVTQPFAGQEGLTVYGALCFAKDPQSSLPLRHAFIDLVAYAGDDRADEVILRGEAKGRLDEQVLRAIGWLKVLGIQERYEGPVRHDTLVVPERAFREAVVNAVVHRDYALTGSSVLVEVFTNRVDIISPGTLPNHMTEATVLAGAAPRARNQFLVHHLLVSGLMERRGRGFPTMRREMRAFNGTEPRLVNAEDGRFVRVTLLRRG
jgi:ATP-dependent DNA helicase RecG